MLFRSEGEKQLANLLMLMDLTKEFKALFLLDEFDAYLHPNWQRMFVKMISEIDIRGQVLLTTHSPATVSKIKKDNLFRVVDGTIRVANRETYNRSLDNIMEENMGISLRSEEFKMLEKKFRNAVMHGQKKEAETILSQIQTVISEEDPFFVTAKIALSRMR